NRVLEGLKFARQPQISSALAVRQIRGGTRAAIELREFEALKDSVHLLGGCIIVLEAAGCFAPWMRRAGQAARRALARTRLGRLFGGATLPALLAVVLTGGCIK